MSREDSFQLPEMTGLVFASGSRTTNHGFEQAFETLFYQQTAV
jgi:hypothetical protein